MSELKSKKSEVWPIRNSFVIFMLFNFGIIAEINVTEVNNSYPNMIPSINGEESLQNYEKIQNQNSAQDFKSGPQFIDIFIIMVLIFLLLVSVIIYTFVNKLRKLNSKIEELSMNNLVNTPLIPDEEQNNIITISNPTVISGTDIHIDRSDIEIQNKIGDGDFGTVHHGILRTVNGNFKKRVVLRRLKIFIDQLHREVEIIKNLEHANVLNLIGLSVDENGVSLVVLPLMEKGDLHSYLIDPQNDPPFIQLLKFGFEVAQGMEYLSKRNIVHRDLAARNCMLDYKLCVKVADYELARNIYQLNYYKTDVNKFYTPLIRWMSIESIEIEIYNTNTDIWSYGVLLWELITRGVTPYIHLRDKDVLAYIKSGHRLVIPEYCPKMIYDIMCLCWSIKPSNRPGFALIYERLKAIIINPKILSNFDERYYNNSVMYSNAHV